MQFDLDDLRLIAHVADTGSLSAAASRMHRSLAAVSARIQNLEHRAGMRFFDRQARGVRPTPPGEALVHHARTLLAQVERMRGDLREYAHGLRAHVRIFANTTAVSDFLPQTLARFLAAHPEVDVDLQERATAEIVEAVRDGSTDIGIISGSTETEGLRAIHFSTDRLLLAVPRRHRLARRKRIRFIDTLDESHVAMHETSTLSAYLTRVAEGAGRSFRPRIRLRSFDAMCRMIEAGVGIGVLPESSAIRQQRDAAIARVELDDAWALRERFLLIRDRDDLPPSARALLQAVIDDADPPLVRRATRA